MRCGPAAGTGREKSSSGVTAGRTEVRMRSPASMVCASSSSTTRVSDASLRRAPRASAWLRAALPALATPCFECVAHCRRDEPVTSSTPASDERDHEDVDAHAADERAEDRPLDLPEDAAVGAHVGVAEERVAALAAEDAEGVGRGGERHPGDDQGDAPAQPPPRAALLLDHEEVGDEPEEEGQREGEDADQPAGGVAQPAAERAAVPAEVQHEGEEHGDGETGDGAELPAMPGGRGLGLRLWRPPRRRAAPSAPRRPCADVPVSGVQSPWGCVRRAAGKP